MHAHYKLRVANGRVKSILTGSIRKSVRVLLPKKKSTITHENIMNLHDYIKLLSNLGDENLCPRLATSILEGGISLLT